VNYLEPVTLIGTHVCLEPLEPAKHAPPMFQHFEPRVMDFMGRGREMQSASELEVHLAELNDVPNRINWAVVMLESGAVAGRFSYSDMKPNDRWLEIGTMLMPAFWGGAANPEGKLLLMTRAFEVLGANRVQFKVDTRNARSQAAMEKLGAVREGTLREHQIRSDGYVRSSVMYSVLKREWPDVKAKLEARVRR
jgi:RimJ/RimL family protein N-acetyltransferase